MGIINRNEYGEEYESLEPIVSKPTCHCVIVLFCCENSRKREACPQTLLCM